jgi:ATP-dependent RNA helicase DDX46/PRP5
MAKDRHRRRSPSSSPDRRRRRRSRSRDRDRRDHREHHRRRSRSRDRRKEHKRRRTSRERDDGAGAPAKVSRHEETGVGSRGASVAHDEDSKFDVATLDKEKEAQRLEEEMRKRRERIEKWREEKKKKELLELKASVKSDLEADRKVVPQAIQAAQAAAAGAKWSLDDDADDDEGDTGKKQTVDEEEEDPLDAYMASVHKEVKRIKGGVKSAKVSAASSPAGGDANGTAVEATGGDKKKKAIVIMTGVAKKKEEKVNKGELMEQNQDGLEYSSEDEEKDDGLEDAMNKLANKGKKEIVIDHNKIVYQDFEKDFYREVPEIARMTPAEVELYREELEGIKVKGKNVPKPIKTWPQCGVSSKILDILKKNNFEKPTPIQAQAIPVIMSGRDMIGIAKTGSGKFTIFLLKH